MSLQERTLVIKNFDPDKVSVKLLKELCLQTGPVRNVVLRPDHAFIEYEDIESVGYSKAMLDGVNLFGRPLIAEPKLRNERYLKYTRSLNDYIAYDRAELEPKRMQRTQGNQMKMLTLPPLPPQLYQFQAQQQQQHLNVLPQNYTPVMQQPQQQQQFPQQTQSQPIPITQALPYQQAPVFYPPVYNQHPQQQSLYYQQMQNPYQAPMDVLRYQSIQTSPYIADPLRPPPEGRGYMPWLHEPMNRSQSFNNMTNTFGMHQTQQRRLSDKPANFSQRRR